MNWIKHSTTSIMSEKLQRVHETFKLQGIGMYWIIVEKIALNNGCCRLQEIYTWACRGMKSKDIDSLVDEERFGLFRVIDDMVFLTGDLDDGSAETDDICQPRACTHASADAPIPAPKDAPIQTGTDASDPIEEKNRIDKNREECLTGQKPVQSKEKKKSIELSPEEISFNEGMKKNFPQVCAMKEPLTYQQYQRLRVDGFTDEQLRTTLCDMQNYRKLTSIYVSANLTLRKWLRMEKRY